MPIKKIALILSCFLCVSLFCACNTSQENKYDSIINDLFEAYGGKKVTYNPMENSEIPEIIIKLYSRGKEIPDEFEMIESAYIWYSEGFGGGDAAVFKVINATDTDSVAKMCARRANTLKYSAGIKTEVITDGHYVIFLNVPKSKHANPE